MELSSGPAVPSKHHLRTVQTTAEGTPFSGSMNMALRYFCYVLWKNTYLLTYLLTIFLSTHFVTSEKLGLNLLGWCIIYDALKADKECGDGMQR